MEKKKTPEVRWSIPEDINQTIEHYQNVLKMLGKPYESKTQIIEFMVRAGGTAAIERRIEQMESIVSQLQNV